VAVAVRTSGEGPVGPVGLVGEVGTVGTVDTDAGGGRPSELMVGGAEESEPGSEVGDGDPAVAAVERAVAADVLVPGGASFWAAPDDASAEGTAGLLVASPGLSDVDWVCGCGSWCTPRSGSVWSYLAIGRTDPSLRTTPAMLLIGSL